MTDVNHLFFVEYVEHLGRQSPRVLDFGCGNGTIIRLLRTAGIDAYGAEAFYEGASFAGAADLIHAGVVREIAADGTLPFDDRTFDVVVSNQVFEHVVDLDRALDEIHRVLKDDGIGYHHFPSREVVREGHVGVPLVHRLPPSRIRFEYARAARWFGLGHHKGSETATAWARIMLDWLDRFCVYRPYDEIVGAFGKRFSIRHREIEYCRFRARSSPVLAAALEIDVLTGLYERLFRRLGFMALETRKI